MSDEKVIEEVFGPRRVEKTVDKLGPVVLVQLGLPQRWAAQKMCLDYDRADPAWSYANADYVLHHGVLDAQTQKPLKTRAQWGVWGESNWPVALSLYNEIEGLSDPVEEAAKN